MHEHHAGKSLYSARKQRAMTTTCNDLDLLFPLGIDRWHCIFVNRSR